MKNILCDRLGWGVRVFPEANGGKVVGRSSTASGGRGRLSLVICLLAGVFLITASVSADAIKTLVVSGQSNPGHNNAEITGQLKSILEGAGRFTLEEAVSPAKGEDMSGFKPAFSNYQLVVLNYDGDPWPAETRNAFAQFMRTGGGLVVVHSADNAFPEWKEFNEMIGLGGWRGRTANAGPYLRFRNRKWVAYSVPGVAGSHGQARPYVVTTREPEHPIMRGLPAEWLHLSDELYDRLRGPAKNVVVLASAMTDTNTGGSGEEEPVLMAITYGQGRIFHTTMGHDANAMKCLGFAVTLQRGAEWAATGKVTQTIPPNFPTVKESQARP
jgi:uncharacterized protein